MSHAPVSPGAATIRPPAPRSSPDPRAGQPGVAPAARRPKGVLDATRSGLSGTPGRLRLLAILSVLVAVAFALLGGAAFQSRAGALATARDDAEQLVRLQSLATDLVQADADATNAFLTSGLEPTAVRADYTARIAEASRLIAQASRANPSDAAELGQVNAALTTYTGLIEQARANNRQGFQVGSAYLRQASTLMRDPKTGMQAVLSGLVKDNEQRVSDAYSASSTAQLQLVLVGLVVLVLLLLGQGWLALRTHRILNVPLSSGTAAILIALVAGLVTMGVAGSTADDVRQHQYSATVALSRARIAAFDAKSQESLTLINRGNGAGYELAWQSRATTARTQLQGALDAGASGFSLSELTAWTSVHQQIRAKDDGGDWDGAVALATGTGPGSANAAFSTLATRTGQALDVQATGVRDRLGAARTALVITGWLVLVIGVLAAGAAWWGVSLRLEEYR